MSEQEFLAELKELLEKYPEMADKFVVENESNTAHEASERATATSGNKRCVRWGIIPGTNKRVCIEWEDA